MHKLWIIYFYVWLPEGFWPEGFWWICLVYQPKLGPWKRPCHGNSRSRRRRARWDWGFARRCLHVSALELLGAMLSNFEQESGDIMTLEILQYMVCLLNVGSRKRSKFGFCLGPAFWRIHFSHVLVFFLNSRWLNSLSLFASSFPNSSNLNQV